MEQIAANATPYMVLLICSIVLLVFHILLHGSITTRELGADWNAGPRDEGIRPKSVLAGRAERASLNYRETYPAAGLLIVALAFYGDSFGIGLIGGWVWLLARIAYIPLYLQGIPKIRSLIWIVSMIGIAMMIVGLFV